MKYLIYKLEPKSPFHIGIKEGSLEETLHYIPSDTLFSAFCNVYRLIYGKEKFEQLLRKFTEKNPPFLFSSIFPCINGKPLFPLPKSVGRERLKMDEENKKIKKIEYVDEDIFKALLNGKTIEIEKKNIIQDKILSKEIKELVWKEIERPRVTIDRKTNSSEIYYFGEVVFMDKLYFLVDLKDEKYKKEIETTLRVLGDEGIGGDRTYGRGLFSMMRVNEIEFYENDSPWHVILSMLYPTEKDLKGLKGYFELVARGGWVYSVDEKGKRRKFIRMFMEGSVFNKKVVGKMVEVAKGKHAVYRYGYAFSLPIRVRE